MGGYFRSGELDGNDGRGCKMKRYMLAFIIGLLLVLNCKTLAESIGNQGKAAESSRIGEEKSVSSLIAILRDRDLRGKKDAARQLVGNAQPSVVRAILGAWDDLPGYCAEACLADGGEQVYLTLINLLDCEDQNIREKAAHAIGRIITRKRFSKEKAYLKESFAPLVRLLDDEVAREAATFALQELCDKRAVAPLMKTYVSEDGTISSLAGIHALGQLQAVQLVPVLMNTLESSKDWQVRMAILRYLPAFGDVKVIPVLFRMMHDPNWDVTFPYQKSTQNGVNALMRALIGFRFDKVNKDAIRSIIPVLIESAEDPDPRVVKAAVRMLGHCRVRKSIPILTRIIENAIEPDQNYQEVILGVEAIWALGRIGDASVEGVLERALESESAYIASAAAHSLADLGSRKGFDVVMRCLHNGSPNVREESAKALGIMKDPRAFEPLLALLEDKNKFVRKEAEYALENISSVKLGNERAKWEEWWSQHKDSMLP